MKKLQINYHQNTDFAYICFLKIACDLFNYI